MNERLREYVDVDGRGRRPSRIYEKAPSA